MTTVSDYLYEPQTLPLHHIVTEARHLRAHGVAGVDISARLGWRRDTLLAAAKRAGRQDLIELLKAETNERDDY